MFVSKIIVLFLQIRGPEIVLSLQNWDFIIKIKIFFLLI